MNKQFRIAEIFGPTVQGEGRHAGCPAHFIRFGGCDYRCRWCDSPHAVLPEQVAKLEKLTTEEIVDRVVGLPKGPEWVVLSGGNPALLDLRFLHASLLNCGYHVMIETQGSVYRSWIRGMDEICVSPKPPSARSWTTPSVLWSFFKELGDHYNVYLKIVLFEERDYEYAKEIHKQFPNIEMYLSVGTPAELQPTVGNPDKFVPTHPGAKMYLKLRARDEVSRGFARWAERIAHDWAMHDVKLLPQLHVLAWGVERGH